MTMFNTLADGTANSFEGWRYYGFALVWRRLIAGLVDWLVALGWGAGLGTLAAIFFGLLNVSSFRLIFILGLIFLGFPITCVVVLWKQAATAFRISSKGDTFGHRLFGLRIVTARGARIGRYRALVRQFLGSPLLFAYFVPMILMIPIAVFIIGFSGLDRSSDRLSELGRAVVENWLIWGLGVSAVLAIVNHVWMWLDAQGRGWHDRLVGTVVVRDLEDVV